MSPCFEKHLIKKHSIKIEHADLEDFSFNVWALKDAFYDGSSELRKSLRCETCRFLNKNEDNAMNPECTNECGAVMEVCEPNEFGCILHESKEN